MTKSPDSTANCPHCDAPLAHLRRGCDACDCRVSWDWTEPCPACDTETEVARSQCRDCGADCPTWDAVVSRVYRERPHADLHVAKDAVPAPTSAGFVMHVGDPRGQRADYRRPFPDGTGVHVKEFADRYEVHWDEVDPTEDFLGHVLADAPHWLLFGGLFGVKLARWPVGLTRGLAGHIKS